MTGMGRNSVVGAGEIELGGIVELLRDGLLSDWESVEHK